MARFQFTIALLLSATPVWCASIVPVSGSGSGFFHALSGSIEVEFSGPGLSVRVYGDWGMVCQFPGQVGAMPSELSGPGQIACASPSAIGVPSAQVGDTIYYGIFAFTLGGGTGALNIYDRTTKQSFSMPLAADVFFHPWVTGNGIEEVNITIAPPVTTAVPEPAGLSLMLIGVAALALRFQRKMIL